jgi:hypothetical protein
MQFSKYECLDCSIDTHYICEYYVVIDAIWRKATTTSKERHAMLCVGCLEIRIKRKLIPTDFKNVPVNKLGWQRGNNDMYMFPKSFRLLTRLGY